MAGAIKTTGAVVHCDVEFEGILSSSIRPKLIHDILKYLCYQRQQIPLAYNHLKADIEILKRCQLSADHCNKLRQKRADKQKVVFVNKMENLLAALEEAFRTFHPVKEVIILLGTTLVSPKEVYRICLPTEVLDGRILTQTQCQAALFRSLVGADILKDMKDLKSLSKWTVLLKAPRHHKLSEQFVPRLTFKPPYRGHQFLLNFSCHGNLINPNISQTEGEFEISGIEPLDDTCMSLTLDESGFEVGNRIFDLMSSHITLECDTAKDSHFSHSNYTNGHASEITDYPLDESLSDCDNDLIWYEVKPSFKGFKV